MTTLKGYSKKYINKFGNTVVYFAENIPAISKTKTLKLIYLLEELSVKEFSTPFLNIDFKAWEKGPVAEELYYELNEGPVILEDFIDVRTNEKGEKSVYAKVAFKDDDFSDDEIFLLNRVYELFAKKSATELIGITHKKFSPWDLTVDENGLREIFQNKLRSVSDVIIDLGKLLQSDPNKLEHYKELKDFRTNHQYI